MIRLRSISSLVLFSTVKIVAHLSANRHSVGTAFFFSFKVDDTSHVPVLITNKHVVAGAETGEFLVHESVIDASGQETPGSASFSVSLDQFEKRWIAHPENVDLVAMPFEPLRQAALSMGRRIFSPSLDESLLPTQEVLQNLRAIEDVTMVGYPIGLWDSVNNLPVLRHGYTASHPAVDFCGQAIGVVDIAAFPGSSGSPILILNEGGYASADGFHVSNRIILLGVLFGGPEFTADGRVEIAPVPTATVSIARTAIPAHLGYYIKSAALDRLKEHLFATLRIK